MILIFNHLIFIEDIPTSSDILSLEIKASPTNSSVELNDYNFLKAIDNNPRAIKPGDKMMSEWSLSPWGIINFLTPKGKYEIKLNLGGLGIMKLPNGKSGAILFDFSKNEKP